MANILIIDDSKLSREIIHEELEEMGHEVILEGKDGDELISLYESNKIDLVIIDLEMPHIDGISASRNLLRKHKDAKILMLTSVINSTKSAAALNSGIKKVVNKPIETQSLKKVIDELLG